MSEVKKVLGPNFGQYTKEKKVHCISLYYNKQAEIAGL